MNRAQALQIWNTVASGSAIVTGRTLEAFANQVEEQFKKQLSEELRKEREAVFNNNTPELKSFVVSNSYGDRVQYYAPDAQKAIEVAKTEIAFKDGEVPTVFLCVNHEASGSQRCRGCGALGLER